MLRLPHVVLSMAVVLGYLSAAAAAKQGEGTYTATQSVAGYDGKGELRYTLRLTGNGDAELTCQRSGTVDSDRYVIRDYGDIVTYLEHSGKTIQRGDWDLEGSHLYVTLNEMNDGRHVSDLKEKLSGRVSGSEITFDRYDRYFYGDKTDLVFRRSSSSDSTKNALLAGAVLLALGAVASNQHHHDSQPSQPASQGISQLDYQSGGSGRFAISGERYQVETTKVQLYPSGKFQITVNTENEPFSFSGRWRAKSPDYVYLEVDGGFGNDGASGTGQLYLRNSREFSKLSLSGKSRYHARPFSLEFEAGRG